MLHGNRIYVVGQGDSNGCYLYLQGTGEGKNGSSLLVLPALWLCRRVPPPAFRNRSIRWLGVRDCIAHWGRSGGYARGNHHRISLAGEKVRRASWKHRAEFSGSALGGRS